MSRNCDDLYEDVFQERHCLTWKTDIMEHKVREINFGSFKLVLELQPRICQSMVYIFLYDKCQSRSTFDIKAYLLIKEEKQEFEQLYKGSLKNGPTIWSMKRSELLKNENIFEARKLKFGFEISPVPEKMHTYAFGVSCNSFTDCTDSDFEKESTQQKNPPSLEKMSLDFGKLFDNEEGSDVILKCADRQIKAHRYILSARSDVFAAMFKSGMLESQKGVVTINDVAPEVLEQMLRYIYSGKTEELTLETASKLYKASDQYGIGSLKNTCASFLRENVSHISACDVLLLADTYSDEQLEISAMDFMVKNCASLRTDQWDKFCEEHPCLGIKVYRKYLHRQPQGNNCIRFKPY